MMLPELANLVERLSRRGTVLAVPGNHDEKVGWEMIASAILDGGGFVLSDKPTAVYSGCDIYGKIPQTLSKDRLSILCAHNPSVFPAAAAAGFRLVLAGHVHGGQVELWSCRGRSYPAAFAYTWNGTRFELNGSSLLVSRGLVDFIPIRWRCPREVLYFEV